MKIATKDEYLAPSLIFSELGAKARVCQTSGNAGGTLATNTETSLSGTIWYDEEE